MNNISEKGEKATIKESHSKRTLKKTLLIVFLASICFPVYFNIGENVLSASRLAIIIIAPTLSIKLLLGKRKKIAHIDILVALYAIWFSITVYLHNREVLFSFLGSNLVISVGGFIIGRALVRSNDDLRYVARILGYYILVSFPFALIESQTELRLLADLIDNIPFIYPLEAVNYNPRMGIYRVQFLTAHPIHYGLLCAMTFPLLFIGLKRNISSPNRIIWSSIIAISSILSVSSGAIASLLAQILLLILEKGRAMLLVKWRSLLIILVLVYAVLEGASTRPVLYVIAENIAFSKSTANLRLILFDYGIMQVSSAPIFGIGYNNFYLPFFMSGSIDNWWLLLAITTGLPAMIYILSAVIIIIAKNLVRLHQENRDRQIALAIAAMWVGQTVALATVAVWGELSTITFFFLGATTYSSLNNDEEKKLETHKERQEKQVGKTNSENISIYRRRKDIRTRTLRDKSRANK